MHIILSVLLVKLARTFSVTETRKIHLETWPGHGNSPCRDLLNQGWNAAAFVTCCHQQPFNLGMGHHGDPWWEQDEAIYVTKYSSVHLLLMFPFNHKSKPHCLYHLISDVKYEFTTWSNFSKKRKLSSDCECYDT